MPLDTAALFERACRVRLLLFDVDGVLTDGKILLGSDGVELKRFDIRDGTAIVLAQRAGLRAGLLSARHSTATTERAAQLGITIVQQRVRAKLPAYKQIVRELGLGDEQVAYMGDDLLDLPVLSRVGLSAAPADAVKEVRERVHWVAGAPGGEGAVRELIEMVLEAQHLWSHVVDTYLQEEVR